LVSSEYFNDVGLGDYKKGVQCQDVRKLTYPNESFDVCTSTEVFEHVSDDLAGFSEIFRVLKSDGIFVFTVPLNLHNKTVERVLIDSAGEARNILPPEYHGDPIGDGNKILVFRNYGYDILERLTASGFNRAEIRMPAKTFPWGYARPVIVAYRGVVAGKALASDPLLLRYAIN
jgi:SAM-dependent methyltransferase